MTSTPRIKCPACARSAAILSRKIDGAYRGLTLADGSQIYSCSYDDCHLEVFHVHDAKLDAGIDAVLAANVNRLTAALEDAGHALAEIYKDMPDAAAKLKEASK